MAVTVEGLRERDGECDALSDADVVGDSDGDEDVVAAGLREALQLPRVAVVRVAPETLLDAVVLPLNDCVGDCTAESVGLRVEHVVVPVVD